jgi:hypothetical protein
MCQIIFINDYKVLAGEAEIFRGGCEPNQGKKKPKITIFEHLLIFYLLDTMTYN